MNANDIDWTQAPEGYDYYIVDKLGLQESKFHRREGGESFGTVYVDEDGLVWFDEPSRIEIFERPEQSGEASASDSIRLRCISSDRRDDSFTVGSVYEVIENDPKMPRFLVKGDDDLTWAIDEESLEFCGDPEIGTFEIVVEESSNKADFFDIWNGAPEWANFLAQDEGGGRWFWSSNHPEYFRGWDSNWTSSQHQWVGDGAMEFLPTALQGTCGEDTIVKRPSKIEGSDEEIAASYVKSEPEFGDIVHYKGRPFVFIRVDSDGDYVLRDPEDEITWVKSLGDIDEYASQACDPQREVVQDSINAWYGYGETVETSHDELIDFILTNKDEWA